MARLEDHHWWYRGLRAMIDEAWAREVGTVQPSLLDVGCGTGGNLAALRERLSGGLGAGVDTSPEAIACCHVRGLTQTLLASAEALPFGNAAFDVVLSCDVLSHCAIGDVSLALREMARVLRPGGTLILNLPAYEWLLSSHDRAVQQDKRYTRGRVAGLLHDTGFDLRWLTHWNSFLLPAAIGVRLWRKLRPPTGSDLAVGSGAGAGGALGMVLAAERAWLRHRALAAGLSVFAVASRRQGAAATCRP